jgi:hypothetical protein
MTTPNHAVQSGLIQFYIYPKWYLIVIAMIFGGLPDLCHLFDKKGEWFIYNKFHEHIWWKWFIPYVNLHLLEDYFTHKKEGGMNKYYKPAEIFLWVVMVGIIIINIVL